MCCPAARHLNAHIRPSFVATALYDYEATRDDELTFSEGESIEIINRNDDGWFEGVIGSRRGLFPGLSFPGGG